MTSASLLTEYPLTRTSDVDEARAAVSAQFCDHSLTVVGPGTLDVVHNGVRIAEDVGINYIRYGASVRIVPCSMDDFLLLQLPLRGRALVEAQGRTIATDRRRGSLLSPDDRADLRFSAGYEQVVVYFRRSAVDSAAAVDESAVPVHFQPDVVLDHPAIRNLGRLVQFAISELDDGRRMLRATGAARALEGTLIHALLGAQPNSSWGVQPLNLSSRAVRSTIELIEARPADQWTVTALADHVGVAPRTLQDAFRRQVGTPPMELLRRTRLRRVRDDLLRSSARDTSVTDVAARWGLFHLGRFARAYLLEFGELPSATLGR